MKKYDHSFFQNRDCEYFPCHGGVPEEEFNCLFCYCPLYCLGEKCGGGFSYTENLIKNCRACSKPHEKDGYEYVRSRFAEINKARILVDSCDDHKGGESC